ncbi:MAG: DUF4827 domain-containing protein [Muribaculaceae bacterium]|nr:DUF4827 domain-containing protein [Muribaculaceae bacterium]
MKKKNIHIALIAVIAAVVTGCSHTKSYSELLNEEEKAVNWFLADHKVVPYIPKDSVFEVGPDAPYYKMDEDGYVYMQIVNQGDMSNRPQKGDIVYFRYRYRNIKELYQGIDASWVGNADNLQRPTSSLIFGNTVLSSTTSWGEGIQVPLKYVGYNSDVNLVISSPQGQLDGQTLCLPFQYNVKYFKAEY